MTASWNREDKERNQEECGSGELIGWIGVEELNNVFHDEVTEEISAFVWDERDRVHTKREGLLR